MSQVGINSSEDAFNQLFLWPQIVAIARPVSETIDIPNTSEFLTGQAILHSMTKQLKMIGLYRGNAHVQYTKRNWLNCLEPLNKEFCYKKRLDASRITIHQG